MAEDPNHLESEHTNRIGVSIVATQVHRDLHCIFREQFTSDVGVDAQVDVVQDGVPTGRLIALQIKSGHSWFNEPTDDDWTFRFKERHARLWLGHALPVMIVLVDTDNEAAYWQRVDASTVQSTGKDYKLLVPRTNTVSTAAEEWRHAASGLQEQSQLRYGSLLTVLPPSTVRILSALHDEHPADAAVLAAHLADGRSEPLVICQALLTASPAWLTRSGGTGWRVLGSYAAEHGEHSASAEAFERAAEQDAQRRGRLLAAAGLHLVYEDRVRSRKLLTDSVGLVGAELLAPIGLAFLDHPDGDASPWSVAAGVDLDSAAARKDATAQAFLAEQALRRSEPEVAVGHSRRALDLDPDNSGLMIGLANALARRSITPASHADDQELSRQLLEAAIDQRHRWDGPTDEPLDQLLRMVGLLGDFEAVLRYAAPPPAGEARLDEAARPNILRHAVTAAWMLGDTATLRVLVDRLDDSPLSRLQRAEVLNEPLENSEVISLWEQVLDSADRDDDYIQVANAVQHLARCGVDASDRLRPLVDRSIVPAPMRDLAVALAAAQHDLDQALPALRHLAATNPSAAEQLVDLLAEAGRVEEAVTACTDAYRLLRQPHLLYLHVDVLLAAERWDEAEDAARAAIAEPAINGRQRGRLLTYLAGREADRGNWVEAERQAAAAVRTSATPRPDDIWRLVETQVAQRHYDRAAATIGRFVPTVKTNAQARLWVDALTPTTWDEGIATEALTLAHRFADDATLSAALLARIIQMTRADDDADPEDPSAPESLAHAGQPAVPPRVVPDTRPVVPAELHRRAFAALNAHIDQHGDAAGIQRLHGSPEELLDYLRGLFEARDHRGLRDALEMVRAGRAPLGFVSSALGKSYALALVQRAAGVQVAGSAADDQHDLDLEGALNAINQEVLVDASALLLSSRLPDGNRLRAQFPRLLLPSASRDDIVMAGVQVQGTVTSTGTIGWDDQDGRLVFYEMTPRDRAILEERASSLDVAARSTVVESVAALPDFPGFNMERDGPWLAPVQLAKSRGLALWSDDAAVRQLARSEGVPSFGTPALTEALTQRAIDAMQEGPEHDHRVDELVLRQQSTVRALVAEFVVDVPAHLDDVLAQAAEDDWRAHAGAVVLARAPWWAWQSDPYADLLAIYAQVEAHQPEALPAWQMAAMEGVAAACAGRDGLASALMGVIAILGFTGEPSAEQARSGFSRAQAVATRLNLPDPVTQAPTAVREVTSMNRLPKPAEFLEELLRGLE